MEVQRIRDLRLSHPFHPSTLILKDGRRLAVEVPYRLAISPRNGELAYGSDAEGPIFIKAADVSDVEVINGQGQTK